jgi:hypothetical protein
MEDRRGAPFKPLQATIFCRSLLPSFSVQKNVFSAFLDGSVLLPGWFFGRLRPEHFFDGLRKNRTGFQKVVLKRLLLDWRTEAPIKKFALSVRLAQIYR